MTGEKMIEKMKKIRNPKEAYYEAVKKEKSRYCTSISSSGL